MNRTRIKICGLTREADLDAAIAAGADAVGFVFYPPSPRNLSPQRAAELLRRVPAFITTVGLFVNAEAEDVRAVLEVAPVNLLQFHGDEDGAYCRKLGNQFGRPWIKAARVRAELDLLEYAAEFEGAAGLLLDAYVEGYGGGGKTFDWNLIPARLLLPVILSGGLDAGNVAAAVKAVRPWAVDVSSGVESLEKGHKDAVKIAEFIAGVRNADAGSSV
jgi:phosphoribosylanthranilate isomerase